MRTIHSIRRTHAAFFAALLLGFAAQTVTAQTVTAPPAFPSKRITIVVPSAAGGGLDSAARLLAQQMSRTWGQPVIVDNRAGADGLIATQQVVSAVPDGYTMLVQIPSLLLLKHGGKTLPFDAVHDLLPVSELARAPSVLTVQAQTPVHSIKELADYCNKAAAPCTWGSGQQLSYLYGKRLFALSGIRETTVVPYKGTAPVITDLLGRHITIGMTSIAAPLPYHRSGALRILAINAEKRSIEAPEVPTFREAGLNVPPRGSWYGLFVPRDTPPDVVSRIEKVAMSMAADPAALKAMRELGAEPVFGSAKDFATGVKEEQVFLDEMVRQYPLN